MDNTSVEIRSPRAARIIGTVFSVPCFCIAVLCCLSPFVPVFEGEAPGWLAAFALGAAYFVFGAFIYWPTAKWMLRTDKEGIVYHTGFKCKPVRWSEVAAYYTGPGQQPDRHFYFQLVLLDAQNKILLKIGVSNQKMTPQYIKQWRELSQFVDAQLDGKKVDAPFVSYEPEAIAVRSIEVNWKSKTLRWKIARVVGLACYALFWCGISMALLWYVTLNYPGKPQSGMGLWLGLAAIFSMFAGPLLPYLVWLQIKKRKIAREWEARDKIES